MSDVLHLPHLYRGKVRDLYEVNDEVVLMVASDRLSAFDVVMSEPFPNKGRVLTALTHYWLRSVDLDVPSALISCDPQEIEMSVPGFVNEHANHGRSMLVRRATMLPIECIVRARLAGSAFEEYQRVGTVHQMAVPTGLGLTDAFDTPMFTPSFKVDGGHDINIDLAAAAEIVGSSVLDEAVAMCFGLFARASTKMAAVGLILADAKFELGYVDGHLVVCDEVITPDSARIWPAVEVKSGEIPPSFDKQPFRDWLLGQSWDRTPPPPPIPDDVVNETSRRYVACYESVTGLALADWYGAPT